MTRCVWDDLVGQGRVAQFLRTSVESVTLAAWSQCGGGAQNQNGS